MMSPVNVTLEKMLFLNSPGMKKLLGLLNSCRILKLLFNFPCGNNDGQKAEDFHLGIISTPLTLCFMQNEIVLVNNEGGGTIQQR